MDLRSRCVMIVKEALREPAGLNIAELLSRLKITKRALYYDLASINAWLAARELGSLEISGKALRLDSPAAEEIDRELRGLGSYQFSSEERWALELLFASLGDRPVGAAQFQQVFDVSRNTIINDIKQCRRILSEFGLSLEVSAKSGYAVTGEEVSLRKLLGLQIYKLRNDYPKDILSELMRGALERLTGSSADFRGLVRRGVEDYERSINTYLVLSDMDYEISMILIACIRSLKGFPFAMDSHEKETLKNTPEYSAVLLIMRGLYDASISLPIDESYYITVLFLGIKNFDFYSAAEENTYIRTISAKLIDCFERVACVSFDDKETFNNRLRLHIRPLYYRLKYGIRVGNALAEQVQGMYSDIFEYTRRALRMVGGELPSLVADSELAFLCIYMASYLGGQQQKNPKKSPVVLIICGAGVAASVLLREQLVELLGESFQYRLVPAREAVGENLLEYCLIVTTAAIGGNWNHVIQTGPILTEDSKDQIIKILCRMSQFSTAARETRDILGIVRREATIQNEGKLRAELLRYYLQRGHHHIPPQPPRPLAELVETGCLRVSGAETIEQIAAEACGVWAGQIPSAERRRDQLWRELIAKWSSGDNWCEIRPGVVLSHRHGAGIAASILVLRRGVALPGGRPASIWISLLCSDNSTHFPLLGEIYRLFDDARLCAALLAEAAKSGPESESEIRRIASAALGGRT